MNDENLIWETQLDNKYNIYVHRVGDYKGVLTINEGNKEIHRKEVPLSYNAQFGPDIADVHDWQSYCVDVVDNPPQYVI